MVKTTRKQREALKRIWARGAGNRSYRELRAAVLPGIRLHHAAMGRDVAGH